MAAIVSAQPHHFQHQQQYPSQSVMEDSDEADRHEDEEEDDEDDEDDDESIQGDYEMNPDHAHFYHQQQQQAIYYQQHQQQNATPGESGPAAGPSTRQGQGQGNPAQQDAEEDAYSDEDSDTDSMPDENIDFSLTYALHTFLATVEGQASVVKGDSLVLLDDANSYWWLVRVLKTEDVGYIPAENIETPYERLARLNKHRNVDLAAATQLEKQAGAVQGRERLKGLLAGKAKGVRLDKSGDGSDDGAGRRVVFAPPTYVDHPGVTWSSDEEDESGQEGDYEVDEVERTSEEGHEDDIGDRQHEQEVQRVDQSLGGKQDYDMEPDDGVEWADGSGVEEQKRVINQKQQAAVSAPVQPKSNNPFAPRPAEQTAPSETMSLGLGRTVSNTSQNSNSGNLDPSQASDDTRRITATPSVASGPLLPSAIVQQTNTPRNVSGQSVASVSSAVSSVSSVRSGTPTSPEDSTKKMKKSRKNSKEDLDGGEKKKKGVLGGLFSRKSKDKSGKGISGNDARTSEDSAISGAADTSLASQGPKPEDINGRPPSAIAQRTSSINLQQGQGQQPAISAHGLRLQQQDQARMQSYTSKYLNRSPNSDQYSPTAAEAAAAVAQSAAAMRLTASMNSGPIGHTGRPSSIIVSPNPAGPPLLNVIRIFAGDHIQSDASFKTALINETTSSADLIRQAMQRFRLPTGSNSSLDASYYITVKDVNGEEMELTLDEKPLAAFQEAVRRWASESEEDLDSRMGAITPTVKRTSVSSISSVISLSSHPAIAKLGMNDFSDDSTVKIYLNRRRPMSVQKNGGPPNGMPEPASEFSSYSTQLSAVQESSPERRSGEWSVSGTPPTGGRSGGSEAATMTPPTPQAQPRFNPSLTISTSGQASPERFSSPSARFTLQLIIHSADLPEGSAFDPSSEAIVSRALLQQRQVQPSTATRRKLFMLPRNANVVDVIEQGLERFGIQDGVVDGGDEIEDKVGKRRSMTKVRYSLAARVEGEERSLLPSSKVLDAFQVAPNLRPMERTTPEQRRRSRDLSFNAGSLADILPSDPIFILRRVQARGSAGARVDGTPRQSQNAPGNRSPAEIIAAQRAASRANQNALISAHANTNQGVDVVVPDKGTFRSSRLMEANGEVIRYSYIDGDGETYDISELLEEEWGKGGEKSKSGVGQVLVTARPPAPSRMETDQSVYHTAPSTPEASVERLLETDAERGPVPSRRELEEEDILREAVQRQEGRLEEKLNRVISKVKSGSVKGGTSSEEVINQTQQQPRDDFSARQTPNDGRSTPPQHQNTPSRSLATLPEGRSADPNATPRASDTQHQGGSRSNSRQANYQTTAVSVNRIISRHRQQPSIASIMSDLESSSANQSHQHSTSSTTSTEREHDAELERDDGASTPVTATSSTHPTPPISGGGGALFTRAINSVSPTPTAPVSYRDDFGMKIMMAVIEARARELRPPKTHKGRRSLSEGADRDKSEEEREEADKMLVGERIEWAGIHPEIKGCFEGIQKRLEGFDREIDDLLAAVGAL